MEFVSDISTLISHYRFRRTSQPSNLLGRLPSPIVHNMDDPELQEGIDMIESIWFFLAIKIVDLAIKTYNLDEEQARALRDVYLKQNNYYVELQV